jgi:hypothetical protein
VWRAVDGGREHDGGRAHCTNTDDHVFSNHVSCYNLHASYVRWRYADSTEPSRRGTAVGVVDEHRH